MYLPVEPGRLIEGPVNRGPENRGCTVYIFQLVRRVTGHSWPSDQGRLGQSPLWNLWK